MAVEFWDFTSVDQVRSLRAGREITRPITILTTDPADSLLVLQRDIPELQRWQPHPTEPGFFVEEFSANRVQGTSWWEGSVRWSDTLIRNPLDLPARLLGVRSETLPGATIVDCKGRAILNTAGDIVAPIEKPERVRIFTFEKNIAGVAQWLFDLEDVCNSGAIRLGSQQCPTRTVLLRSVDVGEEQDVEGVTFRVHTLPLAFRKSRWVHKYPSAGWNQLVDERNTTGSTPETVLKKRPILVNGQPPSQEQLLDADGKWIERPEPQDVVILETDIYDEADLSVLPL